MPIEPVLGCDVKDLIDPFCSLLQGLCLATWQCGILYPLLAAANLSARSRSSCEALLNYTCWEKPSFSRWNYSEVWAKQTEAPMNTVSSAFSTCKFASKNLPLSLSLQEVQISWVSLWLSSSSRTQKKLKAKPTLDSEFHLVSTWKNYPVFPWNLAHVCMQFNWNPIQHCWKVCKPP